MDVQLVPHPALAPFCAIDGTNSGPVVQVPKIIRPYGVIYLSRGILRASTRLMPDLVEELAREMRWVPADEHDTAIADRDKQVRDLETRIAELEPVERAMARAVARHGDTEADDEPVRRKPAAERAPRRR